ncbi:MAG: cytochrome P450, partial [Phenylobacterium sp.]
SQTAEAGTASGALAASRIPAHVAADRVVDFDYVNDAELKRDPQAAYLRFRNGPDLVYTPYYGGHWIATRRELIAEIFHKPELFSTFPYVIPASVSSPEPRPFTEINAPESLKFRRLLAPIMAPKAVQRFEEQTRELMREIMDEVAPLGACDFAVDVAQKLPIFIIMRWLNLPFEDRFMLMRNVDDVLSHPDPERRRAAREFTVGYVDAIVAERRVRPGDDLISALVSGEVDGRPVSHVEGTAMARNLIHGGLDTVRNMMSFIAWFLARHDAHRRQLVDEPALIPAAIEELLRFYALPNMSRSVLADTVFHGVELKRGEQILLPLILAGLDDRVHADAMTVDFRRAEQRHISFGHGAHVCPGQHLARIELRVFVEEWLKRIPHFSLQPGVPIVTAGGIILAVRTLPLQWAAADTSTQQSGAA